MKKLKEKGIIKKAVLSLIIIFGLVYFISPPVVQAGYIYGKLFEPVQNLLVALGDGVMYIANKVDNSDVDSSPIVTLGDGFLSRHPVLKWGYENLTAVGMGQKLGNKAGVAILSAFGIESPEELPDSLQIAAFSVSPELIFANKIPILDANIVNPKYDSGTVASELQPIVAGWYLTFRNIAIAGLLSVLVYTAIRIIIASTAQDKAKYKTMLKDWLVAFCLLFFMHYIMSFATTIVEYFTQEFPVGYITIEDFTIDDLEKYDNKSEIDGIPVDEDGHLLVTFMEYVRFNAQTVNGNNDGALARFGWTVTYLVMVIYTVMFLFIYIKRLVHMIFLTMIAPLVSLTYPLDKMNDGSAQGFNNWLKEYIFNLLIQPLHLILYYVLMGSAIQLAVDHPIYALVCIGFMLPAEKILRGLFGFNKAPNANSLMSGALGGAFVMNQLSKIGGMAKGAIKGGASKIAGASGGSDAMKTKFKTVDAYDPNSGLANKSDSERSGYSGTFNINEDYSGFVNSAGGLRNGGKGWSRTGEYTTSGSYAGGTSSSGGYTASYGGYAPSNGEYTASNGSASGSTSGTGEEPLDTSTFYNGDAKYDDIETDDGGNAATINMADDSDYEENYEDEENSANIDIASNDNKKYQPVQNEQGNEELPNNEDNQEATLYSGFNMNDGDFEEFDGGNYSGSLAPETITGAKRGEDKKYTSSSDSIISETRAERERREARDNELLKDPNYGKKYDIQADREEEKRQKELRMSASTKAAIETAKRLGFNRETAKKVGKGAFKATLAAGGAVAAGTIGVAAGLASEDYANVGKFGAAGAAVGAGIGGAAGERISKVPGEVEARMEEAKNIYNEERYGKKEAQKRINEKIINKEKKNPKLQKRMQQEFKENWKEAMDAYGNIMSSTGVNNEDDIIKTMKMMEKRGLSYDAKLGKDALHYSKQVSGRNDVKDIREELQKDGRRSEKQIKELENTIREIKGYKVV